MKTSEILPAGLLVIGLATGTGLVRDYEVNPLDNDQIERAREAARRER